MCRETIDVCDLDDEREAYEVEQYLTGLPFVREAEADFMTGVVEIEYDETTASHDDVLDQIEHSGCKPSERIGGIVDRLKTRLT